MNHQKKMFYWYVATFILIWMMVMLGGATRLTHSGLSIVEWKPIVGIIPPLSEQDWLIEFQKYQQSPEYIKINNGMLLSDFKFIFWMEFLHRLLGRLIGLVFFIPLIFFWKNLDASKKKKSLFILLVGSLQGAMGWYMVKSGLVNEPHVSPFRLTAHLALALAIMGFLMIMVKDILQLPNIKTSKKTLLNTTVFFITLTILYGGLVAGFKAGLIYNTYPLMEGQIIPDEFFHYQPLWINFFTNHASIQWIHRTLALLTFLHVYMFFVKSPSFYSRILMILTFCQFLLGILTLLYQVPVALGTIHQGMGALVFSWSILMLSLHKKA